MTELMTSAPLRFVIEVPRYRWRLEDVDGRRCLVPGARMREKFTGAPGVLKALIELTTEEDALDFANEYNGLFVRADREPLPELVQSHLDEAMVLSLLLATASLQVHLARLRARPPGVSVRDEIRAIERALSDAGPTFVATLSDLRLASRPLLSDEEGSLLAWIDASAREHMELYVPLSEWVMMPLSKKQLARSSAARTLIDPWPRVRCLSLLGYAYAQLIVAVARRSGLIAQFQAVEPNRLCGICGDPIPLERLGRKVRSDRHLCFRVDCRRVANTAAQRRRRSGPSRGVRVALGAAVERAVAFRS